MNEAIQICHDERTHRFTASLKGSEAYLRYNLSGNVLDLSQTYVPEEFRGRGIAEKLCHSAFEYAKAKGFTIIPSCPYIAKIYLKRHPEYGPLIKRARTPKPTNLG